MKITAKFDGSYRKSLENVYSIGIGYSIKIKDENIHITKNDKYDLTKQLSAEFAESVALIELLETLQEYKDYDISISGDCKYIIDSINRKKYIPKISIQSEYITLLIDCLKENNNVKLSWVRREQNKTCDKLSKSKEEFTFSYINKHNKTVTLTLKSYSEEEANYRFQQILQQVHNKEVNEIKEVKKKSINTMIKEFKKKGIAYA